MLFEDPAITEVTWQYITPDCCVQSKGWFPAREGCAAFHVVYMLFVTNYVCKWIMTMEIEFVCLTSDSLTTLLSIDLSIFSCTTIVHHLYKFVCAL